MTHSRKRTMCCRGRSQKRGRSRSRGRSQRGGGGDEILSPALFSNKHNAHFGGKGFTDPQGAVTGCTGSTSSPAALRGADIFNTIGGITMKGGRHKNRCSCKCGHKCGNKCTCNCSSRNTKCRRVHKCSCKCGHKCSGKCKCKSKNRMHHGGSTQNTNGYAIAGVHLKPGLVGIANNISTAYNSCKG